jgi:hypothetical protein
MRDYFESSNNVESTPTEVKNTFKSIYGWTPTTDTFLGINLIWPKFDLPLTYNQYFLSWHTEQFDLHWLRSQANHVYPRPILVANDGVIDLTIFPDNVKSVQWITWGDQLDQLVKEVGVCEQPTMPEYKISSLCFRISQYKNYISAYLLQHCDPTQLVLTYHKKLGKPEDLHGYPQGVAWLDELKFDLLEPTWINFQDDFDWAKNTPVANGDWRSIPYENALVNFTNESFHYSASELDGTSFVYPAPYLTEKTWKPLLAGRPFLAVGQYNTYKTLNRLGLKTNFGFSTEFDQDPGDLTRIRDIFGTVDIILSTPIKDLYEQSYDSVVHNVQSIKNGNFTQACHRENEQARGSIQDFLSV